MIETKDKAHASQAIGRLEAEGFQVSRLEGGADEASKRFVACMVRS
jgi:hypothetical protein